MFLELCHMGDLWPSSNFLSFVPLGDRAGLFLILLDTKHISQLLVSVSAGESWK